MTKQTLKEGLKLFGFELTIEKMYVTFEHENIEVSVSRALTEEEVKLLLLNIPRWTALLNECTE